MTNHSAPTPEFDRVIEDVRKERLRSLTPDNTSDPETEELFLAVEKFFDVKGAVMLKLPPAKSNKMHRENMIRVIGIFVGGVEAYDRANPRE